MTSPSATSPRKYQGAALYLTPDGLLDTTGKVIMSKDDILAALQSTPSETATIEKQFIQAVKNLVSGGPLDLTDSPKSLIANIRRFLNGLDETSPSATRPNESAAPQEGQSLESSVKVETPIAGRAEPAVAAPRDKLQRFTMRPGDKGPLDGGAFVQVIPDPDGEWVRYTAASAKLLPMTEEEHRHLIEWHRQCWCGIEEPDFERHRDRMDELKRSQSVGESK